MSFADWGRRPNSSDDDDDDLSYTSYGANRRTNRMTPAAVTPPTPQAAAAAASPARRHQQSQQGRRDKKKATQKTPRERKRGGNGGRMNDGRGDLVLDMGGPTDIDDEVVGVQREDFHVLGEDIRSTIEQIAHKNVELEKSLKKIGGKNDTQEFRHGLSQNIEYTVQLVKTTEKKMNRLKDIASSSGGVSITVTSIDQPKFLYEKLKKEFTKSMSKFKQVTDGLQKKQRDFVVKAKKSVHNQRIRSSSNAAEYYADGDGDAEASFGEQSHLLQAQKQKQREDIFLLENAIQHNESLIAEREDEIMDIESNILEINDIFRELNIMVHEQGGHLDIVEDNVEDTSMKVQLGNQNLKTATKYDKKGRVLICLLLVLLVGIIAAIAITLVVLKSLRLF